MNGWPFFTRIACAALTFTTGGAWAQSGGGDAEATAAGGTAYFAFAQPITVNLAEPRRFLNTTIQLAARDPAALAAAKQHEPALRHALIMLFSSQTFKRLSSPEERRALQDEALAVVAGVLEHEGAPGVDGLYFTSLVVQ